LAPWPLRSDRLAAAAAPDVDPGEEAVILRAPRLSTADTVDEADLRRRLLTFARFDRYRALWLRPSRREDGVAFDVDVAKAPRRIAAVGVSYDNTMGG